MRCPQVYFIAVCALIHLFDLSHNHTFSLSPPSLLPLSLSPSLSTWKKFIKYGRIPWKFLLNVLLIVLVTIQV